MLAWPEDRLATQVGNISSLDMVRISNSILCPLLKLHLAVEINLRLPSMRHGKKGFDRLVWAFKNVLNESVTWLFHDFSYDGLDDLKEDGESTPKCLSPSIQYETKRRIQFLPQ